MLSLKSRSAQLCSHLSVLVWVASLVTGAMLVARCRAGLQRPQDTPGLVRSASLLTGSLMLAMVGLRALAAASSRWPDTSLVVRRVSLSLVLLCVLAQLSSLGLMWWASFSLASTHLVTPDNCFCVAEAAARPVPNYLADTLLLNVSCPAVPGATCDAVFREMKVNMGPLPISIRSCQRLDKPEDQDEACLQYSEFWFLFKILRIVFPLLAVFKLPFLILNCFKTKTDPIDDDKCLGNFAADSKSWIGTEKIISFKRPSNPSKKSTKKLKCSPYFGARLAPLGEENDERVASFVSKPNMKKNIVGVFSSQDNLEVTPPRSAPPVSIGGEEEEDCVFTVSPSSASLQNTMSTPIQQGTRTPSFDLSRVARPHQLSLQPAPGSAPPVSTFRATCPALLRDQLERVDAADTRPEKADIFLFSAAYRPPLAPRLHGDRARHGSLPDAANCSSVRVKSGITEAP